MISGFRRYRLSVRTETIRKPVFDVLTARRIGSEEPSPSQLLATYTTERVLHATLVGARSRPWETRQMQAQCLTGSERIAFADSDGKRAAIHLEFDTGCTCGIYITKTEEMGRGVDFDRFPVLANVVGWGHYVEYEEGWKVQFARIESMSLRDNTSDAKMIADVLERTYEVPVQVAPRVSNCCNRKHLPQLFKSGDADVPICKLPPSELARLYKLYEMMSLRDTNFARKMWEEFRAEADHRSYASQRLTYIPPVV